MGYYLNKMFTNDNNNNNKTLLVAILAAILNFVVTMLPINQLNIVKTGFIDQNNLHLDMKIMVLGVLESDL